MCQRCHKGGCAHIGECAGIAHPASLLADLNPVIHGGEGPHLHAPVAARSDGARAQRISLHQLRSPRADKLEGHLRCG
eukprot:6149297-Prymnesium_polylepis.1